MMANEVGMNSACLSMPPLHTTRRGSTSKRCRGIKVEGKANERRMGSRTESNANRRIGPVSTLMDE